jgi:hypothetical protein
MLCFFKKKFKQKQILTMIYLYWGNLFWGKSYTVMLAKAGIRIVEITLGIAAEKLHFVPGPRRNNGYMA